MAVKGLKELERKFKQLDKALQERTMENAVLSGALLVMNAAIQKCPRKSGNLVRSIHIGGHANLADTTGSDIGLGERGKEYLELLVGTDVAYAPYVEFGTKKQTAKPYLRPAFDEQQNKAKQEIQDALWQQINNVS